MPTATRAPRRNGAASQASTNGAAATVDIDTSDLPFNIEKLDYERIKIDRSYQRKLKPKFVKEMVADFRPGLIGTPTVSRRSNGDEVMIDGQHRREVLLVKKADGKVPARWAFVVYEGLSRAQEAQLYVDLKTKQRGILSTETFIAQIAGKDRVATMLRDAVESVGYKVGAKGEPDTISAPGALKTCLRRGVIEARREAKRSGRDISDVEAETRAITTLEGALILFRQGWKSKDGSARDVPEAWHIRGMYDFVLKHQDFDPERMVRRLSINGPGELLTKANHAKQLKGGRTSNSTPFMVEALEAVYGMTEGQVRKAQG